MLLNHKFTQREPCCHVRRMHAEKSLSRSERRPLHLRHAMLVAIRALHPMNVVLARLVGEGSVHLLHFNSAVRHRRVTGGARRPRTLVVPIVARHAAQAFMHTHRRPVVSRTRLRPPVAISRNTLCLRQTRSMALIAESLPLVGTHLQLPRAIIKRRNRQRCHRKVHLLPAIKHAHGLMNRGTSNRDSLRWLGLRRSFTMNPVTRLTGNRRPSAKLRP